MARIRNIKPEFFRHEALQDLEAAHPGAYIMLTYIALWTQSDKNGVFAWKPRTMRLDILPFLQIDIEKNLQILLEAGYIQTFENQENKYGFIPTFTRHQVLPTKEKIAPSKYPPPPGTAPAQSQHITGIPEEGIRKKEEGRGRADNAPAHEEENSNQKNETPTPHPEPFTAAHTAIREWARPDDFKALRDIAAEIRYDPTIHGPVADEVLKFTAYYLDPRRHPDDRTAFQADPVHFFQQRIRKWLLDAKNLNRQPKTAAKKTQYEPPPHQRQRTNGNANETTHIGNITGKIISEIA